MGQLQAYITNGNVDQSNQIYQTATTSNGLECPVCWNKLSELPDELSLGPPNPKKRKMDPQATQESRCCCSPCGHLFHRACIHSWLTHHHQKENPNDENDSNEISGPCPICRRTILLTALYPVYVCFDTFPDAAMSPDISNTDSSPIISNAQHDDKNDNHSTSKEDDLLQFLNTARESERSHQYQERREKRSSFIEKYGEDPEDLMLSLL